MTNQTEEQNNPRIAQWDYTLVLPFKLQHRRGEKPNLNTLAAALTQSGLWQKESLLTGLESEQAHQAYAYFHPFVRRFLFNNASCLHLRRTDIVRGDQLEITPKTWRGKARPVFLDIRHVNLTFFAGTQVGLLSLALSLPEGAELGLDDLLTVRDQLRRLYPPYLSKNTKDQLAMQRVPYQVSLRCSGQSEPLGEILDADMVYKFLQDSKRCQDEQLGETMNASVTNYPFFKHWQTLLSPLVTNHEPGDWEAIQLGDDRCASMEWLAFEIREGGTSADEPGANIQSTLRRGIGWPHRGQWMRLCFVDDAWNDSYPYAKSFLHDFEKNHAYDRYWYEASESTDAPSRILNCGYAFTYAGKANDLDDALSFFGNEHDGARFTFRHCYSTMGLVAHFQKAALLAMSARLSALEATHQPNAGHDLRELYEEFLAFTKAYWHYEISPQEQGRELFEHWQQQLRIPQLYAEVRQELNDLMTALNAQESQQQSDIVKRLTEIATWFGGGALLIGILQLLGGK